MLAAAFRGRREHLASIITEDLQKVILEALKRGNTVELKKERGNLVVVEIERKKRANMDVLPKN